MGASENTNIRIAVSDEQDLYTPLSPEDEFNDTVKTYIKSKHKEVNFSELSTLFNSSVR